MPKFFRKNLLTSAKLLPKPTPELSAPLLIAPVPNASYTFNHNYHFDEQDPIQDLLSWSAPARPYKKRSRSYFTNATLLVVLCAAIAILIDGWLLAGALIALLFVVVILSLTPPEDINYKISTQGVTIADHHFYHWYDLESFWIENKDHESILYIRTIYRYPSLLMLVLGPVHQEDAKKVCGQFLPFQEIPPKSLFDKWADFLQKHFPLENIPSPR